METLSLVLALVSVILAVVSVGLAWHSLRVSIKFATDIEAKIKEQINSLTHITKDSKNTLDSLKYIQGSLSTHSVGVFPHHIATISEILKEAKDSIYIASEAGYGCTSAIQYYIEYESILRQKGSAGIEIMLIVPNTETMELHRNNQFDNWENLVRQAKFQELLNDTQQRHHLEEPIKTIDQFKEVLEIENQNAVKNISAFATIFEIGSMLPVNFWVVDKKRAVFAIKSFEGSAFSYAFETRDGAIIEALIYSWSYYKWMVENGVNSTT